MVIKVKQCEFCEVDDLITFIDEEWKKDHIFTRDRILFDWQHRGEDGYNFVLAKENDEIIGVLGYIPTSQYSSALKGNNEIWLAIWKIKEGVNKPGLGFMLLNYIRKLLGNPTICSLGLSQQVIPIYKALKYQVGILSQRAFFNQTLTTFKVSSPGDAYKVELEDNYYRYEISNDINPLSAVNHDAFFSGYPRKNREYLEHRYLNHPRYKYKLCFIYNGKKLLAFFVYRVITVEDTGVARIVDAFGESIIKSKFNKVISKFVSDQSFEYLDIVSNLNDEPNSGFVESNTEVIIPNYFEPLVKNNVQVDFAYKTCTSGGFNIYRGDSDQDRPNL